MIAKYLLVLSIGHVLGDFYFQTEKLAKEKDVKFKGVLKHSLEYFIAVLLVTVPVISMDMILAAIYLSGIHFMIDGGKYILVKQKKVKKTGALFLGDQILHVCSILILAYVMVCQNFKMTDFYLIQHICSVFQINGIIAGKWILVILILHIPSNILIQNLLSGYKPKENDGNLIGTDRKAGRKIGTIERLIMFMFISVDQYAAMGLVLTAKSIARYDKIAKDAKFAEYYLLGTLLSTACVVACKMIILN